ncbi:hypothetical protein ACILD7_02345 [Capnocytophaga canimorsus]|uniref:hypothetical protein n=1 Tax=Capnocytophaga canimorsus TaxID=28188 RepID=UPI0037CED1BA
MKIKYNVYETIKTEREEEIQDEKFICVEWHDYANNTHLTAFIETEPPERTDCKNRQITIKFRNLKIEQLVGSAVLNAKSLLKENKLNKVVSKEYFIKEYNKTLKQVFTEDLKKIELCNEK